jgi:hypothetical protein
LFGYTDTANDPREFEADDDILKSYEGPLPGIRPVIYMGTFPDAWADWLKDRGYDIPEPNWKLYTQKKDVPEYENGGEYAAPMVIPAEEHDTWFMSDQVMDYMKQATDSWCIHLSYLRPHPPWVAPEPYNSLYPPNELNDFERHVDIETERAQHPFMSHYLDRPYTAAPADDKKLARLKSSYFGLMSEVDHNLGRIFDYLKESGQWDDTLIVFTSDHGEQIGDHWLVGKMGYFDASYHIPLIIKDPAAVETAEKCWIPLPKISTSCRHYWTGSILIFQISVTACRCWGQFVLVRSQQTGVKKHTGNLTSGTCRKERRWNKNSD